MAARQVAITSFTHTHTNNIWSTLNKGDKMTNVIFINNDYY